MTEELIKLIADFQMRNEALARELGGTQAERDFWRHKYLEEQPAKEVKPF